jgi:hypothetical protein
MFLYMFCFVLQMGVRRAACAPRGRRSQNSGRLRYSQVGFLWSFYDFSCLDMCFFNAICNQICCLGDSKDIISKNHKLSNLLHTEIFINFIPTKIVICYQIFNEYFVIFSYESMKALCEKYNKMVSNYVVSREILFSSFYHLSKFHD